jgi:hypothetical protein
MRQPGSAPQSVREPVAEQVDNVEHHSHLVLNEQVLQSSALSHGAGVPMQSIGSSMFGICLQLTLVAWQVLPQNRQPV